MAIADHQRQNTGPVQHASGGSAQTDGLLIHLDNGNIIAEPVELGERDQDQYSGDGRRIVIGEAVPAPGGGLGLGAGAGASAGGGGGLTSAMSDIAEELATPAVIEPDRQTLSRSQSQATTKSTSNSKDQSQESKEKRNGQQQRQESSSNSDDEDVETYADVVKHGDEHDEDHDEDEDEDHRSDGGLSRKNSNDRLLD